MGLIVPVTTEDVWVRELHALPPFCVGEDDIVIVSPHPDDETLGCGALIASHCSAGHTVTVVAVTDGERAYNDVPDLASIRIREQELAVAELSDGRARVVRLGLPDSAVATEERELILALLKIVTPHTHLLAPWTGDFHPDHEACGRAAASVASRIGARLSWYFFWTWHRGAPGILRDLSLRSFSVNSELRRKKWQALLRHESQLQHASGEPILPNDLLGPAQRNFEVFAAA